MPIYVTFYNLVYVFFEFLFNNMIIKPSLDIKND